MDQQEYFQFYEGNKMGIKTDEGQIIIPAVYDYVAIPSDNLFTVTEAGYTAYFDTDGNVVLSFSNLYETYGNFTEGLARVMRNGKWGFINKEGEEVIPPRFHHVDEFAEGRSIVRNENDRHGAIDTQGNLVIDYQYPVLTGFVKGYAKFGDLKTWGLIDTAGNVVVPQIYVSIGQVYRNKVTVQVLEGEEYKEGELTIGGGVEWNNNLDHVNAFNRQKKQFAAAAEQLIDNMYRDGCPCEYERFRDYIQWNNPVGFVDQEVLFAAFINKLKEEGGDLFRCSHCGTVYEQDWKQYSAFMYVLNVVITSTGTFINKGAPVAEYRPVALGFYGYDIEKHTNNYLQHDIDTVINYLNQQ